MYCYTIYGLIIESEIELPELLAAPGGSKCDLFIKQRKLPERLEGVLREGPLWMCNSNRDFFLNIPGVARYKVSLGTLIEFDPDAAASFVDVRLYLLGSVLGTVLHQRGLLVLHAGAVEMKGKAVAFVGPSGAGKSTMVAHLRSRGYRVICDDVLAIKFDAFGNPLILPGMARIKLWSDALRWVDHQVDQLVRDHTRLEKFHLVLPNESFSDGLKLSRLYLLEESPTNIVEIKLLHGFEAISLLARQGYKPRTIEALGMTQSHFSMSTQLLKKISFYSLKRPKNILLIDSIVEHLELDAG